MPCWESWRQSEFDEKNLWNFRKNRLCGCKRSCVDSYGWFLWGNIGSNKKNVGYKLYWDFLCDKISIPLLTQTTWIFNRDSIFVYRIRDVPNDRSLCTDQNSIVGTDKTVSSIITWRSNQSQWSCSWID